MSERITGALRNALYKWTFAFSTLYFIKIAVFDMITELCRLRRPKTLVRDHGGKSANNWT